MPAIVWIIIGALPGWAAQEATPEVSVPRVEASLRIDGILDEPFWQASSQLSRLLQQEPRPGADPSFETEIRVLYNEDYLYFGILCRDAAPDAIVATQLARDGNFDVDDRITLIIDPFFDHRNGFFFEVNPTGARADGQVSNNAEQRNREWDGIWYAAARITKDGWTVELAIPFKTLRFKPGQQPGD